MPQYIVQAVQQQVDIHKGFCNEHQWGHCKGPTYLLQIQVKSDQLLS